MVPSEERSEGVALTPTSLSKVQRRKLTELYQTVRNVPETEATEDLNAAFVQAFGHGLSQATDAEAARVTTVLLTEQSRQR